MVAMPQGTALAQILAVLLFATESLSQTTSTTATPAGNLCPFDQFRSDASGGCVGCTRCLLNERITGPCEGTRDTQCGVCRSCSDKQSYVFPISMCTGLDQLATEQQTCGKCRTPDDCSLTESSGHDYVTLFKCLSGEISYDHTICVLRGKYRDPSQFMCEAGTYQQQPLSASGGASTPSTRSMVSPFSSGGTVYPNLVKPLVADLQPGNVLKVFKLRSMDEPFVVVSEGVGSVGPAQAVPIIELALDTFDPYNQKYKFKVTTAFANPEVPTTGRTIVQSAFDHPITGDASVVYLRMQSERLVASCVWSFDGNSLFIVWMDGTISKAVVFPVESRGLVVRWSEAPGAGSILVPLWVARHPSIKAFEGLVQHQCISVPVHADSPGLTSTYMPPSRQVQLLCMFNFARDDALRSGAFGVPVDQFRSVGSYVVRVFADGQRTRLPVDLNVHSTNHASTSLFYDLQFNTVYVTTYEAASFQGRKHVLKIRLSPSYNFKLETSSTAAVQAVPAISVLEPSGWIMPSTLVPPQLVQPVYPEGMSLDSAAVEPLHGDLFFYTPTLLNNGSSSYVNLLYYIAAEDRSDVGSVMTGQRTAVQPVFVQDPDRSEFKQKLYTQISLVEKTYRTPVLAFTLYGGLYIQYPWMSGYFVPLATCTPCPSGLTSPAGAMWIGECVCPDRYYMDVFAGTCKPVRASCGRDEYVLLMETPDSDKVCEACPACPDGYYRNPLYCRPDKMLQDTPVTDQCLPCNACAPGYYIDPSKCNKWSTNNTNPSTDCVKCKSCSFMQNIMQRCTGHTLYDTQKCETCTGTCPHGMYISSTLQRCSGITTGDSTSPFDKDTECVPCKGCDR